MKCNKCNCEGHLNTLTVDKEIKLCDNCMRELADKLNNHEDVELNVRVNDKEFRVNYK